MSVRQRAQFIEAQEASARKPQSGRSSSEEKPQTRRRHFSFGSGLQRPTLDSPSDRPPVPTRKIIDASEVVGPENPMGLPSRARAKQSLFDWEGTSLMDEGPRPLLPPRPTNESGEVRRASDGSIPAKPIKRNPLVDTFNALDLDAQTLANRSAMQRSKSSAAETGEAAQAARADVEGKAIMASNFGSDAPGSEHETAYEGPGSEAKTLRLEVDSPGFFANFSGFGSLRSPNTADLGRSFSESIEQVGMSMKKAGDELKSMVSQIEVPELWLRTHDGLQVRT